MAENDLNNLPEFSRPDDANKTGIIRWMWWLYVVVGLFVVCLLIWMFVALSKNQIDQQATDPFYIEQTTSSGQNPSN